MSSPDRDALHGACSPCFPQTLRIVKGNDLIIDAMYQQNRAPRLRNGVDRRDVIEACTNHPLYMPQNIPAYDRVGNMKFRQVATHHLIGVGKSTQAHNGTHVHAARRTQ